MTRLILKILSLHGGWYYLMNNTALQGELAAFAFLFWSHPVSSYIHTAQAYSSSIQSLVDTDFLVFMMFSN